MKKFTLLLCLFVVSVMMPQWAMADVPVTSSYTITDTSFIVNSAKAGYLDTLTKTSAMKACKRVVLNGKFNAADLNSIQLSGTDFNFKVVDVSQASFPRQGSSSYLMVNSQPENGNNDQKYIIGGSLYASQAGSHIIEVVLSSASNQFDDVQADWWDKDYATNLAYVEGYRKIRKDVYYEKVAGENDTYTWSVILKENIPANSDIDYKSDKYTADVSNLASDKSYICVHSSSEYSYYHAYSPYSWERQESYNDNTSVSYHYSVIDDAHIPTTGNETIAVGGSLMKYTSNGWQTLDTNDWTVIKFNKWSSSIETAILPAGVLADDLDTNDLWNNCGSLTRIVSGQTSAEIRIENNDKVAYVTSSTTAEFNRMKAIVRKGSFIGTDDKVKEFVDGSFDAVPGYTNVYHVKVKKAGTLSSLIPNNIGQSSVLWFDNECVLDSADIVALLSDENPKYYIDLYDIDKTKCPKIEQAISCAIDTMRKYNRQFKGLVLPANPTTVGTTLIMDRAEDATKKATCSEFIAYRNQSTTTAYILGTEGNGGTYVEHLWKLRDMLSSPAHNGSITDNTTIYSVSSNFNGKITGTYNESTYADISAVLGDLVTNKTVIETVNNEMVSGTQTSPKIYVKSVNNGDFASAVHNTSIKNTPRVDLIQMEGTVSSVDIDSLNRFASGMRVLDLMRVPSSSVASDGTNMISSLKMPGNENNQNTALQYVILPADLDTTIVHSYANLPNLKAMVSEGNTHLTAHLGEAGKLAEARKLAAENEHISSASLKKVTLRGKLNLQDIKADGNGDTDGLHGDANNIVAMDLEKAVFYNSNNQVDCSQMHFANAGFHGSELSLKHVKLPTDVRMDTIPEDCFYETKSLDSLCIPYNYKVILDGALNETNINHITTTDDQDGAFIDNGPNTYTFSRNLTQLGTTPYVVNGGIREESLMIDANTPRPVARSVFPKETGVKDIYNMATLVPKCYKNVFEYSLTFGYGGQDQTKVYCRDRYYNNGDTRKSFTVLRYPSREVYDRRKTKPGRTWEDTYELMEQKYTDITKVYTKKDQTGAVDANGNPLLWPSRTEGNRTYNQACVGALWNDWEISYAGENNSEINDGADGNVSADTTQNNQQNQNNPSRRLVQRRSNPRSDLIDYLGWHQIVLTQATYFEPVEEDKDEVIQREYVDAGWFTFCIPFDMTYSQVVKMMGVPASTDKVENYYHGKKVENNDSLPDIRQLKSVIRTPNKNNTNTNEILFRLTSNLADKENKTAKYYDFKQDGNYWVPEVQSAEKVGETDKRCLVGGRPYIIKAYKRKGETIADANLGKFILTRYVDEFSSAASCVNTEGTYEQLSSYTTSNDGNVIVDTKNTNLVTMKFAKPYENHKVQAYLNSETDGGQLMFKDSNGDEHPYYYAMVGQFWQQDLPQYCVYMTRSQAWKLYTDPNKGFVWDPYKCVIMATPEVTTKERVLETTLTADTAKTVVGAVTESLIPNATAQTVIIDESKKLGTPTDYASDFNRWGGGFRYVPFCYFPMNYNGTKDWIPAPMTLWFFGRNDDSFTNQFTKNSSSTRYVFSLDGDDDIFDFGDDATAVKTIETLNGETQLSGSTRVYSLSGQYMGNTTEGLSKGVYIVGGRKIVVK